MIEVKITDSMKRRAYRKAISMGKLRNSITKGEGSVCGFLGEEIANTVIHGDITNTYDYDIIKDDVTYDVKTKRCTSKPKDYYECSVAAFNTKQKCDNYVFVRIEYIHGEAKRAWILGCYSKQEYFQDAKFLKKGQKDGDNGFIVKADCYNMPINKLKIPTLTIR